MQKLLLKNRAFYEVMWKNIVQPGRLETIMWYGSALYVLDKWGYKYKLIMCNTYCFSAAKMVV
jgi:hypothetical protein